MNLNKSLCAYPWQAAAIRPNGATIPCCRYPNLDDADLFVDCDEPRNSEHWIKLREDMLLGKPISGCQSCYQDEANGLTSMRQYSLTKFVPTKNEIKPLVQLEVALSNLCNLACAHCSNYFSTKWYTEDVRAGRIEKIGVIQNDFSFNHWDLSKVTELKIIGGEPFMEQKRFINLLKNLNLSNISLQICTNGTIMPNDELKSLIESCKNVYLCVSLDGLNTTNDWYRWPSKFNEVVTNMKLYEAWWRYNKNIIPIVHHVVNAINIFELEAFIEYMSNDFPIWKIEWDWIRWPNWQELSALPILIKEDLISKFSILDLNYIDNYIRPNPYKVTIARLKETPISDWYKLKEETIKLSNERNLDFLNMVTSYKELWYKQYD